ncbi:unnamed protein product [Leptosia nina]|uniref:C2H2-type domain-containing protein n=1 Tax=Leptosia nina TaxID=320188 RepID=A0AAV1IWR5_9NEOP
MSVTSDKGISRKKTQKPNILRRNPKAILRTTKVGIDTESKSTDVFNFLLENNQKLPTLGDSQVYMKSSKSHHANAELISSNYTTKDSEKNLLLTTIDSEEVGASINIDSFLINNTGKQNVQLVTSIKENVDGPEAKADKLCFTFIDDSNTLIVDNYNPDGYLYMDKGSTVNTMVPLSAVSDMQEESRMPTLLNNNASQEVSFDDLTHISMRYKCDELNCKKEFTSEEKLIKHKNTHRKVVRHTAFECPVKKTDFTDAKVNCERVFDTKEELLKHLNEDHTINDAAFECDVCERRFFWAPGLRAHKRAHAAPMSFSCSWPGCGRVFRHPCRLREHNRAHTGAKPYHCTYPNCGWSFRTASKLLRHSRRHTGDRRHPCTTCGRAFLRGEHLRDHYARQHASIDQSNDGTATENTQTKTPQAALTENQKPTKKPIRTTKKTQNKEDSNRKHVDGSRRVLKHSQKFMVELWEGSATLQLLDEKETSDVGVLSKIDSDVLGTEMDVSHKVLESEELTEVVGGEESQSARTHCTWPLQKADYNPPVEDYVIEEDYTEVEQLEGNENNVFTVRSDLFLHGSVFHNEDSEQMCSAVRVCGSDRTLDTELMLDAPSVHLAQEELYSDAVDESSFRVFLMSGEELT